MRQVMPIVILCIVVAAWCAQASAQTNPNTTQAPKPEPGINDTVKEFDRLFEKTDRLRRGPTGSTAVPKSIGPVLQAIPQFRKATEELRLAVGDHQSMRVPIQSIRKVVKPIVGYFRDLKLKSAEPDVQELKSYTQTELVWETLTTAERVDNNLQIANLLLKESNRSGAVDVKTLQFYGEIDADLKRLKWLADKVESHR